MLAQVAIHFLHLKPKRLSEALEGLFGLYKIRCTLYQIHTESAKDLQSCQLRRT